MRQRIVRASASLALMAGALLSGCSESSSPAPTPTLALANTGATTATAARGSSATYAFTITRGGGFSAPVQLAAEGVPAGVTASFAPASLTGTTTASTMTLAVDAAAAPGTFSVTVRATGSGVTGQSAVVELVIPNPTIGLQGAATALTVVQGGSGTVSYTVTRGGGFAGAVSLAVEGLPNGVTAAFAPTSLAAGVTTSTLTLTAAAGTSAAVTNLTVRATGTGVTAQTAALALTVSEAPGIVLSNAGEALSVVAGQSGTRTIGIARRGGFAGAVTLALEGAPAGVTGTFAPAAPTTNESVLTLNAAATTAVGSYTLTVRGTGTGITAVTTTVTLVVTEAPGITLSNSGGALSVAAGQSGTRTISIARRGAFAGAVTLALEGAPTGVTGTFAPAAPTANESVLTLNVAPTTAVGNYTLTVRGTGTGVAASTTTLALTVTEAPGVSIALANSAVTVTQGQRVLTTLTITRRGGFVGPVTLSIEGAPARLGASLVDTTGTMASTTLIIDTDPVVDTGRYNISVRAAAQGITPAVASLTATVTGGLGFAVTSTPAAATVAQGDSVRFDAILTRYRGYVGSVNLTVWELGFRNADDGTFCEICFANVSFRAPGRTNEGSISWLVGAAAPPGRYVARYRVWNAASNEIPTSDTVSVPLTIVRATRPTFTLPPLGVYTVAPGAQLDVAIPISRSEGFNAPISLTIVSCGAGLNATMVTPTVANGNGVVRAAVAPGATGIVSCSIAATSPGVLERRAGFSFQIGTAGLRQQQ